MFSDVPTGASKLDVYVAHRAALVDYATPILGCRALAEDVVQEAYFRFVHGGGEGAEVTQPVGYLYRVVRNLALDGRRTLGADQRRLDAHTVLAAPGAAVPSPEERALHQDSLRQAGAALADLPRRTVRAFFLHRMEGWTLHRIAGALGVSIATAHRLVRDGQAAVQRRLGGEDALGAPGLRPHHDRSTTRGR